MMSGMLFRFPVLEWPLVLYSPNPCPCPCPKQTLVIMGHLCLDDLLRHQRALSIPDSYISLARIPCTSCAVTPITASALSNRILIARNRGARRPVGTCPWSVVASTGLNRPCCGRRGTPTPAELDKRGIFAVGAVPPNTTRPRVGRAGVLGRWLVGTEESTAAGYGLPILVDQRCSTTARFACILRGYQMSKRYICRAANGSWARRWEHSEVARSCAVMTRVGSSQSLPRICLHGMAISAPAPNRAGESILGAGFEENAALLGTIWRWRCERAGHGSKTPLLNVGFDKNKASLTKVDMDDAGSVGADRGEEVLRL